MSPTDKRMTDRDIQVARAVIAWIAAAVAVLVILVILVAMLTVKSSVDGRDTPPPATEYPEDLG